MNLLKVMPYSVDLKRAREEDGKVTDDDKDGDYSWMCPGLKMRTKLSTLINC